MYLGILPCYNSTRSSLYSLERGLSAVLAREDWLNCWLDVYVREPLPEPAIVDRRGLLAMRQTLRTFAVCELILGTRCHSRKVVGFIGSKNNPVQCVVNSTRPSSRARGEIAKLSPLIIAAASLKRNGVLFEVERPFRTDDTTSSQMPMGIP